LRLVHVAESRRGDGNQRGGDAGPLREQNRRPRDEIVAGPMTLAGSVGSPRTHFRLTDSTNSRARELAAAGAPDGTLVTAAEQSAGRGRQGRSWTAPAGSALLCSLVVRSPPALLPLRAGVAVAETVDQALNAVGSDTASIKWPNDVLIGARKVAGVLVEGRLSEDWAVVGVGVNVSVKVDELPRELHGHAGTLGLGVDAIPQVLAGFLASFGRWREAPDTDVLRALRARDALRGRAIAWDSADGVAAGIDGDGRLLVDTEHGRVALDAGEVHLRG
jgi:BirA family transcriptional regulator, biotin operon repressor / biotin---[acetyl-CoA-carboxylase] ligase